MSYLLLYILLGLMLHLGIIIGFSLIITKEGLGEWQFWKLIGFFPVGCNTLANNLIFRRSMGFNINFRPIVYLEKNNGH